MAAFHRSNSSRLRRYSPERTDATEKVYKTLDQLRLDRDEVILVGSAALARYGVLPPSGHDAKKNKARPGDVDFVSTQGYYAELERNGTASGLTARVKKNLGGPPILLIPTRILSADIISHDRHASERSDAKWRQKISRESVAVDGTNMCVATPAKLKQELASRARLDSKARADLIALRDRFTDL